MKNNIILFLLIIIISSCQNKFDKTDIFKIGDAIHKSFLHKDLDNLKQICVPKMDYVRETYKSEIEEIQSFYTNNTRVLKMDTSSMSQMKYLDLFYNRDSDFYRLRAYYQKDSLNKISVVGFSFDNLTVACKKDQKETFCPSHVLLFEKIIWTTDYSGTSFKKGTVLLHNYSVWDLNYIKFRTLLKHKISPTYSETFFTQTVETTKKIFSGDFVQIEIPGMTDFYTGFKINSNNLIFEAELIEAGPKPESEWCITIDKLKSHKVTNRPK